MASSRDTVRLMIGDTDPSDILLADGEIDTFISRRTINDSVNAEAAAADACEAIAAKFGRDYSVTEDGQTFLRSQRVDHYTELAKYLRKRAGGFSVQIGGTETLTT